MNNRLEFREKLSGILRFAGERDNVVTEREVETYFAGEGLSAEQMELVCDYLLSQKVSVKGYVKRGGTLREREEQTIVYTTEEQAYLERYREDLRAMKPEREGEREELFAAVAAGDALAKSRLIEIYLPTVVDIAEELYHAEVFLGDLVQEGNVSLMLALDHLGSSEDAPEEIEREIRQGMQMLIEEQTEMKKRDNRLVEKVEFLDENIRKLTEENGRKVSVEELAVFLDMTEDEINDILNLG